MPSGVIGDAVLVEPLRLAFERSGLSPSEVARALEWTSRRPSRGWVDADGTRVKRYLGLVAYSDGSGRRRVRKYVRHETALALTAAIGADPVDFGL